MQFKLKRPVKSPVGIGQTIESVTLRELTCDDMVEGFSASDKISKQIKAMVVRCSNLLSEEIGCLAAADYVMLADYVARQLNGEDVSDPKEHSTTPSS